MIIGKGSGLLATAAGCAALITSVWGADDPGARALEQHQLQRQQQQEALQLRMQQQQRAVQSTPADPRQKQAQEKLRADQQLQQQQLHYRQAIEPAAAQPSDDQGARRAKAERDRLEAQRQGQRQIRQSDWDLQQEVGARNEPGAAVPVPPRQLKIPAGTDR
ncbi:MAG TPA: hypothetical protein VFO57_10045, partial [Burkholderiales bacterium]|nr:hypothetical protein [Burkholderiales bacterium]